MAIVNEKEVAGKPLEIADSESATYLKLVLIGRKTIDANAKVLSGIPSQVDGFFITGDDKTLKDALHKLIDIAFEAKEKANG